MMVGTTVFSQDKRIDSLLTILKKNKFREPNSSSVSGTDTMNVQLFSSLCSLYYRSGKSDSSLHYGTAAYKLATTIVDLAENKVKTDKNSLTILKTLQKEITEVCNDIGNIYQDNGDFIKAQEYYFLALKTSEKIGNKKGISASYNYIATVYQDQANYVQSLEYNFKALKIDEEIGNKKGMAVRYTNIGNVYNSQGTYTKALDYYFKALKINKEIDRKNSIAINLGNIGNLYHKQQNYVKALTYYFEALKMFEKLKNSDGRAISLGNIGSAYKDQIDSKKNSGLSKDSIQNGYYKALDYYLKALKIDEKLGNKTSIGIRLVNIGSLWTSLGKYNAAHANIYKALAISDSIGSMDIVKESYEQLSKLYEKSNISLPDSVGGKMLNKEEMRLKALYYFKNYIAVRDSIFSEENQKQLVRKEMNFEFEKKEALAKAEQVKKDALASEELRQKERERNYFILGFVLVALLAIFIFRGYKQKQKTNAIISIQKSLVEEKQKEIIDSIYYAKRIQQSLLPPEKYIEKTFKRLLKK